MPASSNETRETLCRCNPGKAAVGEWHCGVRGSSFTGRTKADCADTVVDPKPIPQRAIKALLRWFFRFLVLIPWMRLRIQTLFLFFSFFERVTIEAHTATKEALPRKEAFVRQIWEWHALDERRHLAFDRLIMEKSTMPRGLRWLPLLAVSATSLAAAGTKPPTR